MASTAIALLLSLTRLRPIPNPSLLRHFSSDSTNVHDQNKPRSENSTVEASNKGYSFAELAKTLRQLQIPIRLCSEKEGNESGRRPKFVDHIVRLKGKRLWPELVGAHEAAWKIQEEMPEAL